jgi:hypothetical protein
MRTIKGKKVVKETVASSVSALTPELEQDDSARHSVYKKEVRNVN